MAAAGRFVDCRFDDGRGILPGQRRQRRSGTTTIAAALVCYGLGAAVWYGSDTLAIMLAIITTVLLYFKAELHGITAKLSRRDLISVAAIRGADVYHSAGVAG